MKEPSRFQTFASSVIALAVLASATSAEGPQEKTYDRAQLLSAARAIMKAAPQPALITVDAKGRAHVRTMDAAPPADDMVVWFATNPRSRKVTEIRRDPRVTLYYFDPAAPGYVTIAGRARLVDEQKERDRHWQSTWTPYYAHRSDALLIAVVPESLEIVDLKADIEGDPLTWTPPLVRFDRAKPGAAIP